MAIAVSEHQGMVRGRVLEVAQAELHTSQTEVRILPQEEGGATGHDHNREPEGADSKLAHHLKVLGCHSQKVRAEGQMMAEQAIRGRSV